MATSRWAAHDHGAGSAPSTPSRGTGSRPGAQVVAACAAAGLAVAAGLALAGPPALAGASHAKVVKVGTAKIPHVGVVLTTGAGLTLYYFANDPAGKATCTGACAKIYPPFSAPKGARISAPRGVKGLSLINAGNGRRQVAFDHAALYRFEGDTKKGQAKAEGLVGKWFVALKSGITPGSAPTSAAAVTVPTTTPTTAATTTTQAPQAPQATTTVPVQQQTPATSPPPAPTTTPTTAPPPPPTTTPPAAPPPTTPTTMGGYGY
jgi:predicted lipoprotein with Yx(FWY)xxD motif